MPEMGKRILFLGREIKETQTLIREAGVALETPPVTTSLSAASK